MKLLGEKLQQGQIYYISDGAVKKSDYPYSSGRSIEIIFNKYTTVTEATIEEQIPGGIPFIPLCDVAQYLQPDSFIDIIAIVTKVGQALHTTRKRDGTTTTRRELQIIDSECTLPVQLTLWGRFATEEEETISEKVEECPIIIATSIKAQPFQVNTIIDIDPDIEAAKSLKQWSTSHQLVIEESKKLKKKVPSAKSSSNNVTIDTIVDEKIKVDKDNQSYMVEGWIIDVNDKQNPWYPSCSDPGIEAVIEGVQSLDHSIPPAKPTMVERKVGRFWMSEYLQENLMGEEKCGNVRDEGILAKELKGEKKVERFRMEQYLSLEIDDDDGGELPKND
ncbi:uncharacterized protein LOC143852468 [Tasmannia lanceolata]|uniref:uncharacterized protein LOC143852468 n=1 Tax=Tasmannia lanceolata TaxID=3420 RepID=UPI0040641A8A